MEAGTQNKVKVKSDITRKKHLPKTRQVFFLYVGSRGVHGVRLDFLLFKTDHQGIETRDTSRIKRLAASQATIPTLSEDCSVVSASGLNHPGRETAPVR